jgi:hypothetical protein
MKPNYKELAKRYREKYHEEVEARMDEMQNRQASYAELVKENRQERETAQRYLKELVDMKQQYFSTLRENIQLTKEIQSLLKEVREREGKDEIV